MRHHIQRVGNIGKLAIAWLVASVLLLGCSSGGDDGGGNSGPQDKPATLVSINVTPSDPSVAEGLTQSFVATGVYSDNTTRDLTDTVTWSASDTRFATISNETGTKGVAEGLAQGSVTITATDATTGISDSMVLTVTAAILTSIEVTPVTPSIVLYTTQSFTAIGTYSNGFTQDLTNTVTWHSSETAVATVNMATATATGAGNTMISASLDGVSGSTALSVRSAALVELTFSRYATGLPLGRSIQLGVTGHYSDSSTADLTDAVTWSSDNAAIVEVSNAPENKGILTAMGMGATSYSASLAGVTVMSPITVLPAHLASLEITPINASIALGTHQQFTATAVNTDGSTQDVTSMADWSASESAIVSFSTAAGEEGIAAGMAIGSVTISASYLDSSAGLAMSTSTTLIVTPAILESLAVSPTNPSIAPGSDLQFSATGIFSDSTTQDLTNTVTWSSSDTAIATISNTAGSKGAATGIATGSVTITAIDPATNQQGGTTLTIEPVTLVSIAVTPTNNTIALGTSLQFTATGTYSDGTTQDLTSSVNWSSNDSNTATVSNTQGSRGLANSVAQGSVTITASHTASSVSGSTSLTVTDAVLTTLDVSPASLSIALGTTQQFTAIGTYSDSTTQDLTTSVTWSSSDTAVATVSNADGSRGLADSAAEGTVTITVLHATSSISANATLTITSAELTSIDVTPAIPSIGLGANQQFTATGTYSDGTTQNLTASVTWSSSDTAIATISNADSSKGLADGMAQGSVTITATHAASSISGNTSLTVTDAVLSTINIAPASPTIPLGISQQFTATGTYSDGTTQDLTTSVTWNSSDTAIATISNASGSEGQSDSVAQGSVAITATDTASGVSGNTSLTVTDAELTAIDVTPVSQSIPLGMNQQFTATGTYSDGTTQDLTTSVTWNSSDTAIATISNVSGSEGLVESVALGSVTITATHSASGISGNSSATVTPAVLDTITITPSETSIPVGTSQQYTAMGTFTDATVQDVTTAVTWSTSDDNVVTISNADGSRGLATGVMLGAVTISALDPATSVTASATLHTAALTTQRAYVTNQTPNTVSVIDTSTDTVVTTIDVGASPIGVATNGTKNRVYVTNSDENTVSVIDSATNTVVDTIGVGVGPKAVAINSVTNRAYVTNSISNTLSVIDITANKNVIIATVDVGFGPEGISVNTFTNRVYVANGGSSTVSVIDGSDNTVADTITVGSYPRGIATSPATNKTYVSNYSSNTVSVIDNDSNLVVATVPVERNPLGVSLTPAIPYVYVAHAGYRALSVIDANTYVVDALPRVARSVSPSQTITGGVVVDGGTSKVYTTVMYPWDSHGFATMMDTNTNLQLGEIDLGATNTNPIGIAVIQ